MDDSAITAKIKAEILTDPFFNQCQRKSKLCQLNIVTSTLFIK